MTQNTAQNVRTREEQIEALTNQFGEEGTYSFIDDRDAATRHILEAEARGAEEQRRNDAEEQEAVAWLIQDKSKGKPGSAYSPDRAVTDKTHADKAARFNSNVSALYTRPANVAALEERVKELETALANVKNAIELANPEVLTCVLWMPRHPETVVDFISAALTREGGV